MRCTFKTPLHSFRFRPRVVRPTIQVGGGSTRQPSVRLYVYNISVSISVCIRARCTSRLVTNSLAAFRAINHAVLQSRYVVAAAVYVITVIRPTGEPPAGRSYYESLRLLLLISYCRSSSPGPPHVKLE